MSGSYEHYTQTTFTSTTSLYFHCFQVKSYNRSSWQNSTNAPIQPSARLYFNGFGLFRSHCSRTAQLIGKDNGLGFGKNISIESGC